MRLRLCWLLLSALGVAWGQGGPPGASVGDLVFAADAPNAVFAATNAGFFVSYTGGQTWSEANGGLPAVNVRRVAGNGSVQFAALREEGVYRSRNDAAWEFAGDGLQGNDILSIEMSPQGAVRVRSGLFGFVRIAVSVSYQVSLVGPKSRVLAHRTCCTRGAQRGKSSRA